MKVYTFSKARQELASVLDQAKKEGGVRIKRRDGQTFVILPDRTSASPLDVKGVTVRLSRAEIVQAVRESRTRR